MVPRPDAWWVAAFRQGLAEAGFVERRTVQIEYRWASNQGEDIAGIGLAPRRSMAAEDIRNLQPWTRQQRRASGGRLGFSVVVSVLLGPVASLVSSFLGRSGVRRSSGLMMGGLEIDDHFVSAWRLHWQVGWLLESVGDTSPFPEVLARPQPDRIALKQIQSFASQN
jgi:hypothetical protein